MDTDFYTNETPKNIVHATSKEYPTTFLGKNESVETKSYMVVCESFEDVSDSDVFNSPAIFDSYSQMKKKRNLSFTSDKFSRTEPDLKRSGTCGLRFKSISETTILENVLTFQDRKFPENTSNVCSALLFPQNLLLTFLVLFVI